MKKADRKIIQIQNLGREQAVGPSIVEESPPSRTLNGEDIRVRSLLRVRAAKLADVDIGELSALREDEIAVQVVANNAQRVEVERGIKLGEAERHIVSASSPTHGFREDIRQGVLGRIKIYEFHQVNDPIPRARDPFPRVDCHMQVPFPVFHRPFEPHWYRLSGELKSWKTSDDRTNSSKNAVRQ